jgi:hypothetical protein
MPTVSAIGEIRIVEGGAVFQQACRLHLQLDKAERAVVEEDDFTGNWSCRMVRKSPVSRLNPPSPESEMTCRPGKVS